MGLQRCPNDWACPSQCVKCLSFGKFKFCSLKKLGLWDCSLTWQPKILFCFPGWASNDLFLKAKYWLLLTYSITGCHIWAAVFSSQNSEDAHAHLCPTSLHSCIYSWCMCVYTSLKSDPFQVTMRDQDTWHSQT